MASIHSIVGDDARASNPVEHGNGKENNAGVSVGVASEAASTDADESKPNQSSKQVRNSKGWDGKLRVDRRALRSMQTGRDDGAEYGGKEKGDSEEEEEEEDDDDDSSGEDEAAGRADGGVGDGDGITAVVPPAETGVGNSRVEVKDGEEIEADEDLLADLEEDADEIDLVHCKISSIPSLRLERFKKVEKLCLRQNVITKPIFPTSLGSTLHELDLYDNLISKLDRPKSVSLDNDLDRNDERPANGDGQLRGLEALAELTSLDLSFNKIKRIRNLNRLTKLRELYCVQNKISKIEELEELKDLKCLELGANRIREIENLDSLTSLNELWLGKNKITELKGISNLHNLTILSIQSNRLTSLGTPSNNSSNKTTDISNNGNKEHAKAKTDIINGTQPNTAAKVDNTTIENPNNTINSSNLPLSYLTSLTELHVSHNALTSLTGLSAGPESLRTLDISSNPLSSLVGLEQLKNLEELWASNCQLDDWREVERGIGTEVSGKHALETVYLEGNPVQRKQPALYRGKVKLLVPGVRQIDATFVRV